MSSVKKRRLCIIALVLAVCVSLGAVLMIRASAPVEPKTVYLLPKPNPVRAEILKRALQPPKRAYTTTDVAYERATTGSTTAESLEVDSGESSSQESDFEDEDLESILAALDAETVERNSDFPPVPDGYSFTPVWIKRPGYQKGDMPDHEVLDRVLIKLWNQGDHDAITIFKAVLSGLMMDKSIPSTPMYSMSNGKKPSLTTVMGIRFRSHTSAMR